MIISCFHKAKELKVSSGGVLFFRDCAYAFTRIQICTAGRGDGMKEKILFVDDEPNLLHGIRLSLRKQFTVDIASGPLEGLNKCKNDGPYAVVVSDLKMPGADGIAFLEQIKKIAGDSVRMLLTGHGDLDSAVEAVNRGQIFRFMNKPCPKETLIANLDAGVAQYRLIMAEKEVLRGTLRGTIRVLANILSLVQPEAFGRGERVRPHLMALARALHLDNLWQYELAALLSQIGWVSVANMVTGCRERRAKLSPEETAAIARHPEAAAWLLSDIPRMEDIIGMIRWQQEKYQPESQVPLGAFMLKLCLDFDDLRQEGRDAREAIVCLKERAYLYHPQVLEVFVSLVDSSTKQTVRSVKLEDVQEGWIFAENLSIKGGGHLLIAEGHVVSPATMYRLGILRDVYSLDGCYVSVYPPLFENV